MLRVLRQGQRWLVGVIVIGVGGVFIFFMGWGAPRARMASGDVVQVGPYRYGLRAFERERAARTQQYEKLLGDEFDAEALSETLDHHAAEALIQRSILAMAAEQVGLTVDKQEIERDVLRSESFRDAGGRFDPKAFANWAEWEYGNQRNFMVSQRTALLASKMVRLIRDLAYVSEGEAREALARRLEEVQIAFVKLDASEPPADLDIDESQVDAFLATREADVQRHYDENSDRFNSPERVHARHVLIRSEKGADEAQREQARQRANEVLARLQAGADFAEVAREVSEDPGSKDKGGDLGFFGRGQMVKPFEDAAFALEPGSLSGVVESDFGFHVIRTEEFRPAEHHPYEEVRRELAREMIGLEAAKERARAVASELSQAVSEGVSLEKAARDRGLTLERTALMTRRPDGFIPGLGAAQDLMAAAFALEPGKSSPRIFEVGDQLALIQVLDRQQPEIEDFAAQVEEERKALLERKRNEQIQAWIAAGRADLVDRGEIAVNLDARRG